MSLIQRGPAGALSEALEEHALCLERLFAGDDLLDRGRRQRFEDEVRTAET
jgi:hypothetical protein